MGEREAFAELYSFYRTPAIRFCTTLLKDQEEAENVLHEVFIKIWDRRAQIDPEQNFNSYLFTCLRNFTFDYFKQMEKNNHMRELYLQRMHTPDAQEVEEKEDRLLFVTRMVNSLSEKRKRILILNIYEGKSYEEIAGLMKISKNTVKNQLVKAKQILREQLTIAHT
jgi:RNA polymerase sigma-70 factor (family 1)